MINVQYLYLSFFVSRMLSSDNLSYIMLYNGTRFLYTIQILTCWGKWKWKFIKKEYNKVKMNQRNLYIQQQLVDYLPTAPSCSVNESKSDRKLVLWDRPWFRMGRSWSAEASWRLARREDAAECSTSLSPLIVSSSTSFSSLLAYSAVAILWSGPSSWSFNSPSLRSYRGNVFTSLTVSQQ